VPVQVLGLPVISSIAAGYMHTLAVANDGTVWSWGWNSEGQLGNDTQTTQPSPVHVEGLSSVSICAVAAGVFHSLALAEDGTVWAWGQNYLGQLGIGIGDPFIERALTAVKVPDLSGITAIAAGGQHNGYVHAWGHNGYGQLGDGTTAHAYAPIQITSVAMVTAIAAGGWHSLAYAYGNSVAAWGRNNYGQLGDGTTTDRNAPMILSIHPDMSAVLAAGYDHSVLKTPDTWVWSWGHNNNGQLGDATTDDRLESVHGGAFPFLLN
jgi:alpha-tubulin suppressor-like RCC1 family protein